MGFKVWSAVALVAVSMAGAVEAKPKVTVSEKYYTVDTTTVDGLLKQMGQRGPKSYWAYTDWRIKWTGGCALSVSVTYMLPKHKNEVKLDPALQKK